MKKSIMSIVVLVCICAVVTVALALTNYITSPIIEENAQKTANAALLEVLPEGGSFEAIDLSTYTLPATVTDAWRASNGGYVIKLTTTGYSSGMVLMCGIAPDGTVVGTKMLSSAETPAIGGAAVDAFSPSFVGKTLDTVDGVDTVSGATKTTAAYRAAVKDALNAVVILGGGSVDLRSEEEILNDNLSEALPSATGEFNKYFFVEVIDGIDAVYLSKNETGAVCVIGERFIAIDASGTVLGDASEADAKTVKDAMSLINATKTTDLNLADYEGIHKRVVSAKKTATGNYILEIEAAGYGITGGDEYHPASGEYILIRVSLTAEGKIIDCLTLSQKETDGIGSACADESFYGQFDGKTEANYNEIDAITGATLTTDGYKKAILRAFEAVKVLEEGNR